MIFVFGSNLAGRHGKGAAKFAFDHHGAIYGQGVGRQGNSYAIPTKDANLNPLPLLQVEAHVELFSAYAHTCPHEIFLLTRVGCGLAGNNVETMRNMFSDARLPENVVLHKSWLETI